MKRVLEASRFLVLLGVLGLGITTIASFGWGVAKSVKLVGDLVDGGWKNDAAIVDLLSIIDLFLLATVQLITAVGLYELFIGPLDLPEWLEISSVGELKHALVEVFVVFLAVKFIEKLVEIDDAAKTLRYGIAVGVVIVALAVFTNLRLPGQGSGKSH